MQPTPDLISLGITDTVEILHNPNYETLYQEETRPELSGFEKGIVSTSGAVAVDTGVFTGRSPKDKYIVRDDNTRDTFWWSDQGKNDNKPLSEEHWKTLKSVI